MAEAKLETPVSVRLVLEGCDLSRFAPNKLLRRHWSAVKPAKDAAHAAVLVAWAGYTRGVPAGRAIELACRTPFQRARVRFQRVLGPRQRALDPDGATGASKYLLDGLVRCGVLAGDTEKHVELEKVDQSQRAERPAVIITVEPLAGAGGTT